MIVVMFVGYLCVFNINQCETEITYFEQLGAQEACYERMANWESMVAGINPVRHRYGCYLPAENGDTGGITIN